MASSLSLALLKSQSKPAELLQQQPPRYETKTLIVPCTELHHCQSMRMCNQFIVYLSTKAYPSLISKDYDFVCDSNNQRPFTKVCFNQTFTFCYSYEVYALPLDNSIPIDPSNCNAYVMVQNNTWPQTRDKGINCYYDQSHLDHDYLSDPENGFCDKNGHYSVCLRFTVNFDGPIDPEFEYDLK